jgi:hypothetical protein
MNDETLQGLLEKRGLAWDAPQLAPFTLLRCPLCGGAHFATIEMCSVWCRCNARLEVTSIRDDSLTCVLTWRSYWPTATRYILPPVDSLHVLLNLEAVTGDPRDLAYDPRLCGGLDDWRLTGWTPSPSDIPPSYARSWDVDGDDDPWPECVSIGRVELNDTQRWHLDVVARTLSRLGVESLRESLTVLDDLKQGHGPLWVDAPLPPPRQLQEGEHYMLHHWLVERGDREQRATSAWPAWYVVRPIPEVDDLHHVEEWQVVRRAICPVCGRQVSGTMLSQVDERPHAGCRRVWDRTGWRPAPSEGDTHDALAVE